MATVISSEHTQAAPSAGEPLFEQLVEEAADAIYRLDSAGRFTYLNPAAQRITGYSAGDLLGRHFSDLVHPAFRARLERLFAAQVRRTIPCAYAEFPVIGRGGREAWLGQNLQLLRENGDVVGAQAVARDITLQRTLHEELREEEDRFRLMVEGSEQVFFYVHDPEHRFEYLSPSVQQVLGYLPEELLGKPYDALLMGDPSDEEVHERTDSAIRRGSGVSVYTAMTRHRNGTRVPVEVVESPVVRNGRVVGVQGFARDITERWRAEQSLRESEGRFRAVVESLGEGLVITDLEDRITYVNSRVGEIVGVAPDELVGQIAHQVLLPPEEWDSFPRRMQERADGRSERYSVSRTRRPDGSTGWMEIHAFPFRDADGEVVGSLALITDVSERKRAEVALRESEEYFRTLTENAPDLIHVVNADGTTRYFSPSVRRLLGYEVEEMVGRDARELAHPEDLPGVVAKLREARRTGQTHPVEVRVRHRDGSWRIFETFVRNLLDDPVVRGIVINSRDVTERRLADERSLRLAALSRENPSPIVECDGEGRVVHVNPAAEDVSRELGQNDVTGLLPEHHRQLVVNALENRQVFRSVEVPVKDRIFSWSYHPNVDAGVVHLFATDITSRRQMEEQLRHDALHDGLTGLPNRLLFMERLAHAILRAKRRQSYLFAVLFLDLDRFKVINDSLGHHVGDELLVVVSRRLQSCLRTEDTVARLGGDEFAILLENIGGINDAIRIAERIQQELTVPVNLSGFEVFTSASIGIALSAHSYERPEYLLRNADMAMYRAKASGQARYEVFDRAMHAEALARLQMETDLRRALERDEFRLHYQPIVEVASGRIVSFEALLRWSHPDRGWMEPDQFVPVAEETGVILAVGDWVLEEVCRQIREWEDEFGGEVPLSIGINLSAKQLSQPDLVDHIARALERHGLEPGSLRVEITESVVMENAEAAAALLTRIKELGVQIYLDDFGTGYSSLSYLHRFPLDAVKIDRSFVGRMDDESRSFQLVKTVLALARSLEVAAIAEGVETESQLGKLRDLGCPLAQGYYFSPPAEPSEVSELLSQQL